MNKQPTIQEMNFILASRDGFNYDSKDNRIYKISSDLHNYHEDWNKLMRVAKKVKEEILTSKHRGELIAAYEDMLQACIDFDLPALHLATFNAIELINKQK